MGYILARIMEPKSEQSRLHTLGIGNLLLVLCLCLCHGTLRAQMDDIFAHFDRGNATESAGRVRIIQPERLHYLLQRHTTLSAQKPGFDGYRVLIYRGLGTKARQEADRVQRSVLERWAGIPVYVSYSAPYYRVCVGDCRTRQEALAWRNHLLSDYPQCFVVNEWVNFPTTTLSQLFEDREENPGGTPTESPK